MSENHYKQKNAWEKFVVSLERLREHLGTFFHISKTKWDVTNLHKRKNDLFKDLGYKTYHMLQKGNFREEELSQILNLISTVEEKINHKETHLNNISQPKFKQATINNFRP